MNYYSVNKYLKDRFGEKVYKISLDGGFTCPTRDGSLGTRGCIFCSARGSGDFSGNPEWSITEQIERGKAQSAKKMKSGIGAAPKKFIAYFQAFTSTYASVDILETKFREALYHPNIVALSIATRPDCLGEKVLALLADLQSVKPIWVELGLQTIHPASAEYIRRGYTLDVYDKAVSDLTAIGIEQIITHLIIGLPGETRKMILDSVAYVAASPSNGIKLQLLHVLKGTDLAEHYLAGKFELPSLEEYCETVASAIRLLPESMVVHRVTGDGYRRNLIAPFWSQDKWRVLNRINEKLKDV